MTWNFADSFDLYAVVGDAALGYWDSESSSTNSLQAGRWAGSQCMRLGSGGSQLVKSSGVNDAVHHIALSFRQPSAALSGTLVAQYFTLFDGSTALCSIGFRQDGAIVLQSGTVGGTQLDIWTGAFTGVNVWYGFEIEVAIHNTTGSWAIRRGGNNTNDHALGSLNTRGAGSNNYANKLAWQSNQPNSCAQDLDDMFWQSGSSTGNWLGDVRCYTRMPASNQSVTFSNNSPFPTTPYTLQTTLAITAGNAQYSFFTASRTGTIGSLSVSLGTGYTGNMKCSLFADNGAGTAPTTVLGSATPISNPISGNNTFTFGSPVSVVAGTVYWVGFDSDTSSGAWNIGSGLGHKVSTTAYASFPVASPTVSGGNVMLFTYNTTVANWVCVSEPQEDGATSYVFDSNPGDADFYGIASIGVTPATIVATVTRALMQKSDTGSRTAAAQLKSSTTTVTSPTITLTNSGWLWAWRTDTVDPATSAAWTASAVNSAQIGPTVIA